MGGNGWWGAPVLPFACVETCYPTLLVARLSGLATALREGKALRNTRACARGGRGDALPARSWHGRAVSLPLAVHRLSGAGCCPVQR